MIKGVDIFIKEYVLYYLGGIILGTLVGFTKGWGYLMQYAAILFCLFLPILILIQLFVFIRQLSIKNRIIKKEIASFFLIFTVLFVAFNFGLNEKQQSFIMTINIFSLASTLLILLYLIYKNHKAC